VWRTSAKYFHEGIVRCHPLPGRGFLRFQGFPQAVPKASEPLSGPFPFIMVDDDLLPRSVLPFQIIPEESPAVGILMAVNAEVLPVVAVRWVVVVITILMMNRQQLTVGGIEFPAAAGADQTMQAERSLPVSLFPGLLGRFEIPDNILDRSGRQGLVADLADMDPPASVSEGDSGQVSFPTVSARAMALATCPLYPPGDRRVGC
jgi:hypothetical protein